jgi:Ca2+-binding EF-hand superfamily protein
MKARLSVAMLALGFSAAALAQAQAPSFEEVDTNGDGMISQEEAAQVEGLDFATADRNQDGQLDREEYRQATEQE